MFNKSKEEEYLPLATSVDGESNDAAVYPHRGQNDKANTTGGALFSSNYLVVACLLVAALSACNVALLPISLRSTRPLSQADLDNLPYPDQRIGLDRAAAFLSKHPADNWFHSLPSKIVHLNARKKDTAFGEGPDVFVSMEDITIMKFPVPQSGGPSCRLAWYSPPDRSPRVHDLELKGDVSEIEVWTVVAATSTGGSVEDLDFNKLSYATRPVRGEMVGSIDVGSAKWGMNATTIDFACPRESSNLTVLLRCMRAQCHQRFKQVQVVPKMGFELVRHADNR